VNPTAAAQPPTRQPPAVISARLTPKAFATKSGPGVGGTREKRHRAARHDRQDVEQVLIAGPDARRLRERHQHVEHGVEEHRDCQQEPASKKRNRRSRGPKDAQRGPDDAIGPAAVEQSGSDDRGHRDQQADLPARAPETFADPFAGGRACQGGGLLRREAASACCLFDDASRRQQRHEQRRAEQRQERVHAQEQDSADDEREGEQEEEQDEHGRRHAQAVRPGCQGHSRCTMHNAGCTMQTRPAAGPRRAGAGDGDGA
jgi:hypothetical protein